MDWLFRTQLSGYEPAQRTTERSLAVRARGIPGAKQR